MLHGALDHPHGGGARDPTRRNRLRRRAAPDRDLGQGPACWSVAEGARFRLRTSTGPADSRLLGVSIENGIVTLDLSSEFRASIGSGFVGLPGLFQLAHVVYTVTQFPEIEGVLFKLEGRPLPVPAGTDSSLQGILPGCDIPEADELLDRPVTREDYENAVDPTNRGY